MDERQIRLQCMQQAAQLLQFTGQPGSVAPTPESVLALAEKMFLWITTGK